MKSVRMDRIRHEAVLVDRYDPDGPRTMSVHLVRLVAIASDRHPTDLAPLGEQIDTDALDSLYAPSAPTGASVTVTFDFEGYTLEIDADGTIRLFEE